MLIEFYITCRYLFTKRKEKFISFVNYFSLIGIALGVATLIIVTSVMNGFKKELVGKILGFNGHINIESSDYIKDFNKYQNFIQEIDGVNFSIPSIIMQGMLLSKDKISGVLINGVDRLSLLDHPLIGKSITSSENNAIDDSDDQIIIGSHLARTLNVKIGDTVRMLMPTNFVTMFGTFPRMKDFKVTGIFNVGMYEYDIGFAYVPIEILQKFLNLKNDATNIDIFLTKESYTEAIKLKISEEFPELNIYSWDEKNFGFINALKIEKTVMFTILILIILIATFNIVSSLTMLVYDKADSIAIMRTIGFSKTNIVTIFVLCGLLIGFIGTMFGLLIGCGIAKNIDLIRIFLEKRLNIVLFDPLIYFLSNLPVSMSFNDIILITSISMFFSLTATIFPAIRAAKMNPGRLLRFY